MAWRRWASVLIAGGLVAAGISCVVKPPHDPLGSPIDMAAAGPADNNYCFVCHLNMKREDLGAVHAKGGVGCMKCHGFSDKHSSDEDGLTPPETMYPAAKINLSCSHCHNGFGTEDLTAGSVPLKGDKPQLCTDCHGQHRLTVRTRRWDKATGKLIYDDGVRMIGGAGGMKTE